MDAEHSPQYKVNNVDDVDDMSKDDRDDGPNIVV